MVTGGAKSRLVLPAPLLGVVTFMVFTTGSHDMTKTDALKYGVLDVKARGTDNMTDTIVLVSVDTGSGEISYLSIPRDTWVPRYREKINEIYPTKGLQALVEEVQSITGVPVNHVVGLGFTAFGRFTDAVGGLKIGIPAPTRDAGSNLLLHSAGCVHMDGRTALAFARSRHTDVYTPQQGWHRDPGASDLQRETRQQVVADAFVHKLLTPSLPLVAPAIADAVANEITTDAELSIPTLISTAVSLATQGNISTRHFLLPSTFGTVGSASVTFVDPYPASRVLEAFGRKLPGYSLPPQYPTVPAPTVSPAATPSATSSTSTGTTLASPAPVVPAGVDLTKTALYSICG
jgi:LCP family protein required for cell wall assembly